MIETKRINPIWEQTVSLPSSVTGISNTIFLMPKCIKVAIDPPNSPYLRRH